MFILVKIMDSSKYTKYLNKTQQQKVSKFYYIKDFTNVELDDRIMYIMKKNLKLHNGGKIIDIINGQVIRLKSRNRTWTIDCLNNYVLYKSKRYRPKERDFMQYLLESLENNTIKVNKIHD